jgi:hypothetical protein
MVRGTRNPKPGTGNYFVTVHVDVAAHRMK